MRSRAATGWSCAGSARSRSSSDARVGRNPRTGQHVEVQEKYVPFFKTGKEMRERLNAKT